MRSITKLLAFIALPMAISYNSMAQCNNSALTPTGITASPQYVCEGSANPVLTGACSGNCQTPTVYAAATWNVIIAVTVCHSFHSDLNEWYLIKPGGGQIALNMNGPSFTGNTSNCGPYGPTGDTDDGTATITFDASNATTTGWGSSGLTRGISGGEAALNGLDVNASGWGVQVYDCTNLDDGAITGVTITFVPPSGPNIVYSLSTPAIINDGACAAGTAAIVTVPPSVSPRAGWYAAATGGTPLNATGSTYTPTNTTPGTYPYYTQCICGTADCPTTRSQVNLIIVDKAPTPVLSAVCSGTTVNVSVSPALPAPVNGSWEYSFNGGAFSTTPTTTVASGSGNITLTVRNSLLPACTTAATTITAPTCCFASGTMSWN